MITFLTHCHCRPRTSAPLTNPVTSSRTADTSPPPPSSFSVVGRRGKLAERRPLRQPDPPWTQPHAPPRRVKGPMTSNNRSRLHLGFLAPAPTPAATGEFLLLLLSIFLFLFLIIFSSLVAAVDERCGHKLGVEAPTPRTTSSPPGSVAAMDGEDDAQQKQPPWMDFFNSQLVNSSAEP